MPDLFRLFQLQKSLKSSGTRELAPKRGNMDDSAVHQAVRRHRA
jgi:hypothetical protein